MRRRFVAAVVLAAGLVACADDEAPESAANQPVLISGLDYAFEGVPAAVPAGTTLAFTNASEGEAHEVVVYRIDDEETRPLEELVRLPDEQSRELISFTGVSVALPGEDGEIFDGDLTLAEPGRYALVCFVPTGADPQAYLDFVRAPQEAAPPSGGPPHVTQGMFAELVVEASSS